MKKSFLKKLLNNSKNFFTVVSIFIFVFILNFSFAQNAGVDTKSFKDFANNLTTDVIATLGTMFTAAAFMFFFYGVAMYILDRANGKNGEELRKANDFMIWGLAGLFVMVSVWGIIKLGQGLLGENFVTSNQVSIKALNFQTIPGGGVKAGDTTTKSRPGQTLPETTKSRPDQTPPSTTTSRPGENYSNEGRNNQLPLVIWGGENR